jgi:hypothetical protein
MELTLREVLQIRKYVSNDIKTKEVNTEIFDFLQKFYEKIITEVKSINLLISNKSVKPFQYKLRAECFTDVAHLVQSEYFQISAFNMVRKDSLPDVEFEFTTVLTIDELITAMKPIRDAQVMYQTVKPVSEYTGERNYNL